MQQLFWHHSVGIACVRHLKPGKLLFLKHVQGMLCSGSCINLQRMLDSNTGLERGVQMLQASHQQSCQLPEQLYDMVQDPVDNSPAVLVKRYNITETMESEHEANVRQSSLERQGHVSLAWSALTHTHRQEGSISAAALLPQVLSLNTLSRLSWVAVHSTMLHTQTGCLKYAHCMLQNCACA